MNRSLNRFTQNTEEQNVSISTLSHLKTVVGDPRLPQDKSSMNICSLVWSQTENNGNTQVKETWISTQVQHLSQST